MNNSPPRPQTFAHVLTPCCQLSGKVAHRYFICHLWLLWVEMSPGCTGIMPLNIHFDSGSGVITDRVLPDRYLPPSLSFHSELTLGPTVEREQHLKVGIVKIFSITVIVIEHDIRLRDMIRDTLSRVTCLMSWMEWSQLAWLQIET